MNILDIYLNALFTGLILFIASWVIITILDKAKIGALGKIVLVIAWLLTGSLIFTILIIWS